jgi:hypothetical protein
LATDFQILQVLLQNLATAIKIKKKRVGNFALNYQNNRKEHEYILKGSDDYQ